MPKRTDIHKILIIGSGPIVIGQGCEFDYSGTQACKALREEGYKVVLVNSNPATVMTDPEFADGTYIEPITPETVEKIIEREKPDALLPTLGGQTGLNTAMALWRSGVLQKHGVEMIGAKAEAIEKGEDRLKFKEAMQKIGLDLPTSGVAHNLDEAREITKKIGKFPVIIRPAYTLGGTGGGIAYNREEFEIMAQAGIDASPVSEILVEESLIGWKEYETEVMRDKADNCVIVCSIENLDPMGVHTGDSITVAPIQTLTDKEWQNMRDASFACIREIGVETGGSNIQFGVNPENGRMVIIEMNPRVSRSSALASKATGFPIAKIAAKLAIGYTLDEIPNDITKSTPASFEPTIDYVVTKIPRFTFEKFPNADATLTTQMKSVGEVMAIGRTFKESFQKALRGLEIGAYGLGGGKWGGGRELHPHDEIERKLITPCAERIFYIRHAFRAGFPLQEIHRLTHIDPWFLQNIKEIVEFEEQLVAKGSNNGLLPKAKSLGFSDRQIAALTGTTEDEVRAERKARGLVPSYRLVDTCAAEFEAYTPYYYSTYDTGDDEVRKTNTRKVMILGGGPNRIGQGIEFDYCCVHAAFAMKELGFESIMVNSNPETVSTDYDTSDKLYFEPLTLEDVLHIYEREQCWGAIVQFGGQTPLNLSLGLQKNGVNIIGTSPQSIEIAEDRKLFAAMLDRLKIPQPPNGLATNENEALKATHKLGYPVLVRPSFVLGGRAMQIVYSDDEIRHYMRFAVEASPERPVLVDKFLEEAIEVDVDCIADIGVGGDTVIVAGMLEHIEFAGCHSGDAAMVLPPHSIWPENIETIRKYTHAMARELKVAGLMNVQFAVKGHNVWVLEVNPRASRTVPFVSKAIGEPLAKLAAKVMTGKKLTELGFTREIWPKYYSVKESVFPFSKFPGQDIVLGPEMRSTGEVMGLGADWGEAYAKSQMAAAPALPLTGKVFISVRDSDKKNVVDIARQLTDLAFEICATAGTAQVLQEVGLIVQPLFKLTEGRPNVLDLIKNGEIQLVINTASGQGPHADGIKIRTAAVLHKIPIMTTLAGANAAAQGIAALREKGLTVRPLQAYHAQIRQG